MRFLLLLIVAASAVAFTPKIGEAQLIRFHRQRDPSDMSLVRVHGLQERQQVRRQPVQGVPTHTHTNHSSEHHSAQGSSRATTTTRFSSPVRIVDHQASPQPFMPALHIHTGPMEDEVTHGKVTHATEPLGRVAAMGQPHQVLESPFRGPAPHAGVASHAKRHPPILKHHFARPKRAAIPEANGEPVWKTPYSYGYFGASGSKHWHRHLGYRDRSIEWQYR